MIEAPVFYHYLGQWPDDYARPGWTPQRVRDDLRRRGWRGPLANNPAVFIDYLEAEGLHPMTGTLHPHTDDYMVHPVVYDGGKSDYQLHCPVCGHEYVHFGTPLELAGKDNYDAVPDEWVRGDVIEIPMNCEAGHQWRLQIGFHKGYTLVRSLRDPDVKQE